MKFDPIKQQLLTDDGRLIKKVYCPKNLGMDDLHRVDQDDQTRRCTECKSSIVNIAKYSDDDALALLASNPKTCVFALPGTVDLVMPKIGKTEPKAGVGDCFLLHDAADTTTHRNYQLFDGNKRRRIRTARGVDAINQAVNAGYWPLLRVLEDAPDFNRGTCYRQNKLTGKITQHSYWSAFFEPELDETSSGWVYASAVDTSQIVAAYLLPKALVINEEVELLDVISHIVGGEVPMGKVRLKRAHAIWRGDHFEILVPEPYLVLG